jgi:hypothetical protein
MDNTFSCEKRLTARHRISLPVKYRTWKSKSPEHVGESLDISEGGMCFSAPTMPKEGETVEVRFQMPEQVANEPAAEWCCTGQVMEVVKVEQPEKPKRFYIRMRFDCYEVARASGTTTIQFDFSAFRAGFSPLKA